MDTKGDNNNPNTSPTKVNSSGIIRYFKSIIEETIITNTKKNNTIYANIPCSFIYGVFK